MKKTIAELKELLLKNEDVTRFGDGYEKAMIQAIDVCEKNDIKSTEPQLPLGDVSGRSEQLAAYLQDVIGKKYSIYFEQQDIEGLIEAANCR